MKATCHADIRSRRTSRAAAAAFAVPDDERSLPSRRMASARGPRVAIAENISQCRSEDASSLAGATATMGASGGLFAVFRPGAVSSANRHSVSPIGMPAQLPEGAILGEDRLPTSEAMRHMSPPADRIPSPAEEP